MWKIGDRVLARWPGERQWWYPGVVCGLEEARVELQFDDGDRSMVFPFELAPLELPAGTAVQARIGRDLRYIPATVLEQQGNAVRLQFPDDIEVWTSICLVRTARENSPSRSFWGR